jgi:hypothetical protein
VNLRYEVHNFDSNSEPRNYEAVYEAGDAVIVKVVIYQRVSKLAGSKKPATKWNGIAVAWMPGQGESDWTQLAHLEAGEMAVRDVITYEATEDTWLTAAQIDAQKLTERAQPFADVLVKAMAAQGGKRRMKAAA